jgi:hypothetical protein
VGQERVLCSGFSVVLDVVDILECRGGRRVNRYVYFHLIILGFNDHFQCRISHYTLSSIARTMSACSPKYPCTTGFQSIELHFSERRSYCSTAGDFSSSNPSIRLTLDLFIRFLSTGDACGHSSSGNLT